MLMLVGDPEPVWARGTVDDVSSLPADDWHHGDPQGHGTIGLSNGVTLTVLPEGGARAFSVVGTAPGAGWATGTVALGTRVIRTLYDAHGCSCTGLPARSTKATSARAAVPLLWPSSDPAPRRPAALPCS